MRSRVLILCCLALLCGTQAAVAQGLSARMLSRMTSRAISKNVAFAFKPKLEVVNNRLGGVTTCALSRDQNTLAVGMSDGSIRVWDLMNGQQWAAYSSKDGGKTVCIAASSESGLVVSADESGGLVLHQPGASLAKPPVGSALLALDFVTAHQVLGVTANGVFFSWDTQNDRFSILHASGQHLRRVFIAGDYVVTLDESGVVASTVLTALLEGKFAPRKLKSRVKDMAAAQDGSVLFALTGKKDLTALRVGSGSALATFKARKPLALLAASAKGVAAVDEGGNLRYFFIENGREQIIGELKQSPAALLADKDGQYLVTGGVAGTLQLWSVRGRECLATLVSTRKGWAVIDDDGRFAGSEDGLNDIAWTDGKGNSVFAGNVPRGYYEPGLLSKAMAGEPLAEVPAVTGGLTLPPKVEINAVKEKQFVKVTVRGVETKGGGVAALRLYRNGRRVSETRLVESSAVDGDGRKLEITKVYSVPVLSMNRLEAVGVNRDQVESVPVRLLLEGEAAKCRAARTLHILTIGINDYDDPALALVSAAPDADGIRQMLDESTYFQERKHYSLRNREATRENIVARLSELNEVHVDDTVVIYLTGHGLAYGGEWYFLPREAALNSLPEALKDFGISAAELQEIIMGIPADQVVLIVDSCQAGGVLPPAHRLAGLHALRTMSRLSGIHILAATNKEQDALEVDALGHGLLTYAVLEGARGQADIMPKDMRISVREIMDYSAKVVPLLSSRYGGYKQYPTVFSRGYDFYLVGSR